jgi:uncharacterized protein YbaP (TraB family)
MERVHVMRQAEYRKSIMKNKPGFALLQVALLLLGLLYFIDAHAAEDKAFFWKVTSDISSADRSTSDATVYLMGSIHFADKSFYPLRAEIKQAYESSRSLAVELDVNKIDHETYNRILVERGVFDDGTTIKDVISEETWLQLRQRLNRLNVDYEAVKNYRPGIMVLTLSALQVMQMGFDPNFGIDVHFLDQASSQDTSKEIIELETLEQQLDLFLNIPNGDLLLRETLYSLDESELMMSDMVRYWKQGDEKRMSKMLFEDALDDYPAFSDIYDSLFYDRNDAMREKVELMLAEKGATYFVVVGTGHLIGDRGIVNELRKKGYRVERL